MSYFLSIHSISESDELESVTLLSLNVEVSHFPILGKNFSQSHVIITREYSQSNNTHVLIYFNNFILNPCI